MSQKNMKNLYDNLSRMNIIRQCRHLFAPPIGNGSLYIDPADPEKKIKGTVRVQLDANWVMNKTPVGTMCALNMTILFGAFGKLLGQPPVRCQSCWKVSVKPKTLRQLFALGDYMESIKDDVYGCKYGIDTRPYSLAAYGGYIYCKGQKMGFEMLEKHRGPIHELLGDDVPVVLKRACTEYEREYGDAKNWIVTQEQRVQELQ